MWFTHKKVKIPKNKKKCRLHFHHGNGNWEGRGCEEENFSENKRRRLLNNLMAKLVPNPKSAGKRKGMMQKHAVEEYKRRRLNNLMMAKLVRNPKRKRKDMDTLSSSSNNENNNQYLRKHVEQENSSKRRKIDNKRRRRLNYLMVKLVPKRDGILSNNINKSIPVVKSDQHIITSTVKIGDTLNLSHLLFTKNRNYLINYNQNNKQVSAKDLAGRVLVLLFMPLRYLECATQTQIITHLLDIYSKLQPTGGFEIVFVATTDDSDDIYSDNTKQLLSQMPWPAIPLSDFKSREHLQTIFGISRDVELVYSPPSFVIDPRGVVLQCHSTPLFIRYGAAGFPFTNERIELLDAEDNVARMQPVSIQKLLASPQRDYLINNDGDQVPLDYLDDKVVGLYFCPYLHQLYPTEEFVMVYNELLKEREDFEFVLVYTPGWYHAEYHGRTDEAMFLKAFESMPWLALPFEDTNCNKKLQRIFKYPQEPGGLKPNPRLVIIGPHGKFIEPLGGQILLNYGAPAYPFTTLSTVNLELERVKKLKPEMLWDLDSVFTRYDGSQVKFSQLVGKRIIVIFQNDIPFKFTVKLIKRYFKMKGTDDEFEVIHILGNSCSQRSLKNFAAPPWLMHPPFHHDSCAGKCIRSVFSGNNGLLGFDRDGSVVRKTEVLEFGDSMIFPFYHNVDMDTEVLMGVEKHITFRIRGDDDGIGTVYV